MKTKIDLTKEQHEKVKQLKKLYKELRKDGVGVFLDGSNGTLFFINSEKVKGLVHYTAKKYPEETEWFNAYNSYGPTRMKLDPDMVIGLDEDDECAEMFGLILDE